MPAGTRAADQREPRPFARVPLDAVLEWSRADLLTYTALASWPPATELPTTAIRKRARIRRQELFKSLTALEERGELARTIRRGYQTSYTVRQPKGRWVRVPVAVLTDPALSQAAVLVYIALSSFAKEGERREAWPSLKRLTERAGVSARSVYPALAALRKLYIYRFVDEQRRQEGFIYGLRKKPKEVRMRMIRRPEDALTSMYRAAVRGELPPEIPEQVIEFVEEIVDPDDDE